MINNFKALLSKVLSPKGDDIIVNMDGGVGGSWRLGSEEIECETARLYGARNASQATGRTRTF